MKDLSRNFRYQRDISGVDWARLKETYRVTGWETDRTPDELQRAFKGSFTVCLAYHEQALIGTARAISDGLDSAAIFDVWVHPAFRGQGLGRQIVRLILADLKGQYVVLTTEVEDFYRKLGFQRARAMVINSVPGEDPPGSLPQR
jgi:ribosomal protein S18 acetylase RimI-like enzyme